MQSTEEQTHGAVLIVWALGEVREMAVLGQNTLDLFMHSLISVVTTYTQEQSCWLQRAVLGEKTLPTGSKVGEGSRAHSGLPDSVNKADYPRALGWGRPQEGLVRCYVRTVGLW